MTSRERRERGMAGPNRQVEREALVLKFLLNHPESSSNEVWAATKCSVATNSRFLAKRRDAKTGQTLWSVNELKYRHYLRTGNIDGRPSSHFSSNHREESQ